MKKSILLNTLLLFAAGGLPLTGCSSTPAKVEAAAPIAPQPEPGGADALRVGVSPVFPPMVFRQGGQLAGVEVDLAQALGQKLGRKVVFVEVPWENQIEALNSGKTDIIMSSMAITPARRFVVNFSRPYLTVSQMILVRREDTQKYVFGFPLNPKGPLGVIKGTTADFLVQRDFPKARRKLYTSGEEAARALMKGKIDVFISDSSLVWYLAGIHATDGIAVVPIVLSEEQLAWAVRKSDDALLTSVNDFLTQAMTDGLLPKVLRRWMAVGN